MLAADDLSAARVGARSLAIVAEVTAAPTRAGFQRTATH
jgi:hypothetical protein